MPESHGNSGAGSAVSIDKPSPAFSDTPRDTSTELPVSPDQGQGREPQEVNPDESNGDGANLTRVPSQAQKLGKKKIFLIMSALCVRLLACASGHMAEFANLES